MESDITEGPINKTEDTITMLAVTADREFATGCERHLPANADISVIIAETVSEAVDFLADERRIDCIVSDHDLPDTDGVGFLQAVRAQYPTLPFILFTSEGDEQVASRAISANVTDYLIKEQYGDQWDRLATLVMDAVSYYRDQRGLVNTEARAKTLLDASNDMIAVVRDGHVEYINETGVELFGADTRVAVIGQSVRRWMSTIGDTAITEQLDAVQTADRSLDHLRAQLTCADGDDVPVELTATHITWADRPAVVLVVRDIAERKQSEKLLRQFRRAVEAAGHAIYMTDSDGTITYVNPAFERITGYSSEVAVGRTPRILNSGEMSDDYYEELWGTIEAGDVWEEEIRDRRQSGEVYYAHQTIAPLTDEDSDIEAYVAIQTDITEQKEREAQLRQYEHAIEGANDLIAAIDDECRYLFANEAYREFHGFDAESVTGRSVVESIGTEAFENIEPQLEKAFAGQMVQYRMTRSRPVRPDRTFDIRYYPLTDEEDEVWGVVGTMRDRTDEFERERQLESLDRMLRHNIRNELNIIQGRAETISTQATDEIAELAAPIEDAAERILNQSDKVREIVELLSKPAATTTLNLTDVVTNVVDLLEDEYPDAEISVEMPPELELTTVPELERAVYELIENAIVHSDRATPDVTVTAQRSEGTVELSITDNGPGIPLEEQKVIEEDSDIQPLLHSNGMELWLVKRVVTRADGTIRFEDREPHGSTITITLPSMERSEERSLEDRQNASLRSDDENHGEDAPLTPPESHNQSGDP